MYSEREGTFPGFIHALHATLRTSRQRVVVDDRKEPAERRTLSTMRHKYAASSLVEANFVFVFVGA